MAVFGCIWLYMAVYGYIWLYMAVYGAIWLYVMFVACDLAGGRLSPVHASVVSSICVYREKRYSLVFDIKTISTESGHNLGRSFGWHFLIAWLACETRGKSVSRVHVQCRKNALVSVPRESCCFVHLCLSSICVEFVLRRFDVFLHTVICQTCEDNGWHYTK